MVALFIVPTEMQMSKTRTFMISGVNCLQKN